MTDRRVAPTLFLALLLMAAAWIELWVDLAGDRSTLPSPPGRSTLFDQNNKTPPCSWQGGVSTANLNTGRICDEFRYSGR